jgi:hypothetical protein
VIYCTACGTENVDDAQFCYKCGAPQVPAAAPELGAPSWRDTGGDNSPYGSTTASPPYEQRPQGVPPYGGIVPADVTRPESYTQPEPQRGALSLTGLLLGILAAAFFVVGVIPCLGWMNWFTLLIGGLAHLICWLAFFSEGKNPSARQKAIAGLVLTAIVIIIGFLRLKAGGGIF